MTVLPAGDVEGTMVQPRAADVLDVSWPHPERTGLQTLASVAGAAALALAVPFLIVLIGLPVALAIRGLIEGVAWLLGIAVG